MPLVAAKCTQCGSNLQVDSSKEATICPYCGTPFITEKAINNYKVEIGSVVVEGVSVETKLNNAETFFKLHGDTDKARELFEESGLKALSLELFGVFSGEEQHYIYPNGDEVSTIDIVYICRSYSGELKCQQEEVTQLKFFDIDDIPENICPPVRSPLLRYIEYRRGAMF